MYLKLQSLPRGRTTRPQICATDPREPCTTGLGHTALGSAFSCLDMARLTGNSPEAPSSWGPVSYFRRLVANFTPEFVAFLFVAYLFTKGFAHNIVGKAALPSTPRPLFWRDRVPRNPCIAKISCIIASLHRMHSVQPFVSFPRQPPQRPPVPASLRSCIAPQVLGSIVQRSRVSALTPRNSNGAPDLPNQR